MTPPEIIQACYDNSPDLMIKIIEYLNLKATPEAAYEEVVKVCGTVLIQAQELGVDMFVFSAPGVTL